ncbi:MAG: alpha/beta fold hydrolase [Microthrixaceae bacterium]|nr:alpha/beta fold hydrolase [Microthrixaceae bacterium]
MAHVTRGDVSLYWEEAGPDNGPAVLLIMGLGAQLIAWRPGFVERLTGQGYRVIRFDNRDAGWSSSTSDRVLQIPDMVKLATGIDRGSADYLLSDMALDAAAVLDAANVERAHVVGASMGGMIAQQLAIDLPERVASLTSIMSRPGSRLAGLPTVQVVRTVMKPTPNDRAAMLEQELTRHETIGGPLFDRAATEVFLNEAYERTPERGGTPRQLAAILASPDRTPGLRLLQTPTLVIHGRQDRLVRPSGGRATAAAVPGSSLLMVDRMGHDLPQPLWPLLTDAIGGHIRRAEHQRIDGGVAVG